MQEETEKELNTVSQLADIDEPEPVTVHICRTQTLSLTAGERKTVLDLLYDRLARIETNYHMDSVTRREQKTYRAERKRLAFIINKFEGRSAVPHAMPENG